MRVEWHGQSAFTLEGDEGTVFVDPFGDLSPMRDRGMTFDYPPIDADGVDLVLVTHEHLDHNGVDAIGGDPATLRATAGRHESPIGEVVAVASEHDEAAGTARGPNTIFVFTLGGVRVAHFGDFGQTGLRPEQREAIGDVDLVILPVGDGPTIGAEQAARIVEELGPRWVVPMHYRTPRVSFLETEEAFVDRMPRVQRLETPSFDTGDLPNGDGPLIVVPAAP
ncbi:MAG TPA: MBL fold metallo-hydrolase [Solirubrobacteraceae bacterium]|jgi:L-ascorbate metabolism protein UlaG (beta-lactamase superfamily)|nr:MBL fold metallo-hydrolase [Solirubrobacteraceae bacterium]